MKFLKNTLGEIFLLNIHAKKDKFTTRIDDK